MPVPSGSLWLRAWKVAKRTRRRAIALTCVAIWLALFSLQRRFGVGPWNAAYESLRVFFLNGAYEPGAHGWDNVLAWVLRFLAPLLTLGALGELVEHFGLLHVHTFWFRLTGRKHVIVVGLGSVGLELAKHLRTRGHAVAAIERDAGAHTVDLARDEGIAVIIGDVGEDATLYAARVEKAAAIIATTGDDLVNLECGLAAGELAGSNLPCFVQVANRMLRNRLAKDRHVIPFSSYEWVAESLVTESFRSSEPTTSPGAHAVFVILGLGRLGGAVFERLAAKAMLRPDMQVFGFDKLERGELAAPYAALGERIAVELRDIREQGLPERLAPHQLGRDAHVHVLLCTDSDEENLRSALEVSQHFRGVDVKVLVRKVRERRIDRHEMHLDGGVQIVAFSSGVRDFLGRYSTADLLSAIKQARDVEASRSLRPSPTAAEA